MKPAPVITLKAFPLLCLLLCGAACERQSPSVAQSVPPSPVQAALTLTPPTPATTPTDMNTLSEADWKARLTPEQYRILREKGTERAFTGKYWNTKEPGVYACAGCGTVLFESGSKFDSGCGWPSFDKMIAAGVINEHVDTSHGMVRTEVTCAKCGGHLGHVFNDGPTDTGLRYCINSASIEHAKEAPKPSAKP